MNKSKCFDIFNRLKSNDIFGSTDDGSFLDRFVPNPLLLVELAELVVELAPEDLLLGFKILDFNKSS